MHMPLCSVLYASLSFSILIYENDKCSKNNIYKTKAHIYNVSTRQRQWYLCELQASRVYIVNSRLVA